MFSSYISETPHTHTHTGVYVTRAVGLKTQPTRTGFMPPVFREWPNPARARRGAAAHTRAAGFETHLRIVTQKDRRHLFAAPTAREPSRYRVWMLGRALKLTREHSAVAPCTRRVTQFLCYLRVNIRAEPVGSSSPGQYRRSSIPIIYIPNPFST